MADNKKKINLSKKQIKLIAAAAVAIIIIIAVVISIAASSKEEPLVTTLTTSTLSKILKISDLNTSEYIYNGITEVKDSKDNVKYYVAYEGIATAGIDFSEIDIKLDNENKKIVFTLPEVKITNTRVDEGKLDYIFTNDKYNKGDVTQEALKKALKDIETETKKDSSLLEAAKENAKNAVEGLIKPFLNQFDEAYIIEVK